MSDLSDLEDVDASSLAMTREKVTRLAGLSTRQVDHWAATGLVGPTVDRRISPGRRVRLYDFQDVLELLIASELRKKKVSVQHIRQIVTHLRERGYDRPLTQLAFAVQGELSTSRMRTAPGRVMSVPTRL